MHRVIAVDERWYWANGRYIPAEDDGGSLHLPDDGICENKLCLKVRRDHPGNERILALRGFHWYDPRTRRMVHRVPVPYCRCGLK